MLHIDRGYVWFEKEGVMEKWKSIRSCRLAELGTALVRADFPCRSSCSHWACSSRICEFICDHIKCHNLHRYCVLAHSNVILLLWKLAKQVARFIHSTRCPAVSVDDNSRRRQYNAFSSLGCVCVDGTIIRIQWAAKEDALPNSLSWV
jgi:hypothetical protein